MSTYIKVRVRSLGSDNLNGFFVSGPAGIYEMKGKASFILKRIVYVFLLIIGFVGTLGGLLVRSPVVVVFLAMLVAGAYLLYTMTMTLELKVPWDRVKDIVVTNAYSRSVMSLFPFPHTNTYTIGDLQVILNDGSVFKISRVVDAYNKVDYIKARYLRRS